MTEKTHYVLVAVRNEEEDTRTIAEAVRDLVSSYHDDVELVGFEGVSSERDVDCGPVIYFP